MKYTFGHSRVPGKTHCSTAGGEQPVWAHGQRKLFYLNGNRMQAVTITSHPSTFAAGVPQMLFDEHYSAGNAPWPSFAVSIDDQRFLMIREETATQ